MRPPSDRRARVCRAIEQLAGALERRRPVEKALFDDSWVIYPMLLMVAAVWAVELL